MARALPIAYLNGKFLPIETAQISPLDRGFLFGDAVYEVIPVYGGQPLLLEAHLQRLARSLREIRLPAPLTDAGWRELIAGLIARNGAGDMGVYLQVSRGADTGRDHVFPQGIPPTVFGLATPLSRVDLAYAGVRATTACDIRWDRCDIKATSLLANILLRQQAIDAGANEVILLEDGHLTEGSASSVVIVEDKVLFTRPNSTAILPGTTIQLVRELALEAGCQFREEMITEARLRRAGEIWLLGALRGITPVTHLDDTPVGSGAPGPVWRTVAESYERRKHI